jgi:hypothetical protein
MLQPFFVNEAGANLMQRPLVFTASSSPLRNGPPLRDGHDSNEPVCRPNSELSIDERLAKKQLKKRLRQETRLRKLTVRLNQALERRDESLFDATQMDLDEYLKEHPYLQETTVILNHDRKVELYPGYTAAKSLVHSIHLKLGESLKQKECIPPLSVDADTNNSLSSLQRKEFYTDQVRPLMKSMMKGTQTECLFDNPHALVAYTRHKFYERSMLVIDSLGKLFRDGRNNMDDDKYSTFRDCLTKRVSCICSIGCGPGCDAFGAAVFYASLALARHDECDAVGTAEAAAKDERKSSVILLDWTIHQWREGILNELETLIVPNHVQKLETGKCDVRAGLTEDANREALDLLHAHNCLRSENLASASSPTTRTTMYIVSYLLSETRDKWHLFFDDLVRQSPFGTLFLLMDPTAWQLHIWLERYRGQMDFVWLDSSMDRPDLQALMRRFGPAVLLAVKR